MLRSLHEVETRLSSSKTYFLHVKTPEIFKHQCLSAFIFWSGANRQNFMNFMLRRLGLQGLEGLLPQECSTWVTSKARTSKTDMAPAENAYANLYSLYLFILFLYFVSLWDRLCFMFFTHFKINQSRQSLPSWVSWRVLCNQLLAMRWQSPVRPWTRKSSFAIAWCDPNNRVNLETRIRAKYIFGSQNIGDQCRYTHKKRPPKQRLHIYAFTLFHDISPRSTSKFFLPREL